MRDVHTIAPIEAAERLPHWVLAEPSLHALDKLLLLVLVMHRDPTTGRAAVSMKTLADNLGVRDPCTVRRRLKALLGRGFVRVFRARLAGNGAAPNRYQLTWQRADCAPQQAVQLATGSPARGASAGASGRDSLDADEQAAVTVARAAPAQVSMTVPRSTKRVFGGGPQRR